MHVLQNYVQAFGGAKREEILNGAQLAHAQADAGSIPLLVLCLAACP